MRWAHIQHLRGELREPMEDQHPPSAFQRKPARYGHGFGDMEAHSCNVLTTGQIPEKRKQMLQYHNPSVATRQRISTDPPEVCWCNWWHSRDRKSLCSSRWICKIFLSVPCPEIISRWIQIENLTGNHLLMTINISVIIFLNFIIICYLFWLSQFFGCPNNDTSGPWTRN